MSKFTDKEIRAWVKAGAPIVGKADGGGLTFTLSSAGTASWILRYRYGGKGREVTIGNYPDISLQAARAEAAKLRAQIDLGFDVAGEKRKTKLAQRMASTFEELCHQYIELAGPKLRDSTRGEVTRYLKKDVYPRIGKLAAADVTAREVVYVVEQVARRACPNFCVNGVSNHI